MRIERGSGKASSLARLIIQNRGVLPKGKKESEFPQVTDKEIQEIEAAIREISGNTESL